MKILIALMIVAGFSISSKADEVKEVVDAPAPETVQSVPQPVADPVVSDSHQSFGSGDGLMCGHEGRDSSLENCRAAENVKEYQSGKPVEQFKFTSELDRSKWIFTSRANSQQNTGMRLETKSADFEAMVFPRKVVPSAKEENGKVQVTLATGETVEYDAITGKIVSGVLSTKKGLSYTGTGVMIKVQNRSKSDLRQPLKHPTSFGKKGQTVEITKLGSKPCFVSVGALWTHGSGKQLDSYDFKFATDEDFNKWLKTKSKCGFSLD